MKGCYVYFMDKNTENFFRSRIKASDEKIHTESKQDFKNRLLSDDEIANKDKFVKFLPLYSLEAAASGFGKEETVESLGWMEIRKSISLSKNMFIAKVVGKSMEPTISDQSYCIFRLDRGGSRNGAVVLVESRHVHDPSSQQKFTVKRYHSEKEFFDDGTWRHKKIILSPDNKNGFKDITIENVTPADFRVVAEFVTVL